MVEKEQETDRVFDDFRDTLSSEQLANALRSIKEHLEKVKTPETAGKPVDTSHLSGFPQTKRKTRP